MFYTVVALAVRIFANPAANVLQKQLTSRGCNPVSINFTTYLLLSLVCIVPAAGIDWGSMPREFWRDCLLVGLFGGVGNAFLIQALQHGELSVLGPVNSWKSVVGMVVGAVVLGEIPGLWGLFGMAFIVAGSYFVLLRPGERFSWRLLARKDIRLRVCAMVFTAIEAVFIKRIIVVSSPSVSFIVWCWFGAVASFVMALIFVLPGRGNMRRAWRLPLKINDLLRPAGVAACVGLAQYATNVVFERMNVGYALALFQLSAVVSVLLGYKVFSESDVARKLIGSAIMIAGSIVIILLN